ncbi:hypothetical protein ABN028_23505 [Actinopolymorpha sp. B17G11]|uniref:hypothetical protein n=1 Tax=Actinopolymorpha sp. B17G11 TaxID=3160861 RepID=UPI0032E3D841
MDGQTSDSDGGLSEAEHRELLALLHRYCSYDLDQWEAWRMQTDHGEVYIHISRHPAPGSSPQSYDELPSPT